LPFVGKDVALLPSTVNAIVLPLYLNVLLVFVLININEIKEVTINNTHITIFLLDFKIYLLSKIILSVDRRSTYVSSSIYYFLKV